MKRKNAIPAEVAATNWRAFEWMIPLALAAVAFANSFGSAFPLDNRELILVDTRIRELTLDNLRLILEHSYYWPNGEAGIYRPLTTFTYLLNYTVFGNGESPAGYHVVNLLIHLLNVGLVYALARRIGKYGLYIAGLWAVHPVLTEAVTNIIGRSDLLAGTAVLGGLLCYLRSRDDKRWLVPLALLAGAGVASKESAVVLPGVIVLWEVAFGTWETKAVMRGLLAAAIPAGIVLAQRAAVLAASLPAEFPFIDNPITGADFVTGRLTALAVLGRYLKLAVFPVWLSADYSYSQIPLAGPGDWGYLAAVALTVLGTALAWRRNRSAFFFAGFAVLCLLPASNLVIPTGTIMAERLLYLPLVGMIACVVMLAEPGLGKAAPGVLLTVALLFVGRTWVRNADWKDDRTMAEALVRTSPNSFKAHRLLGDSLFLATDGQANMDRVIAEAERSVAILSSLPDREQDPKPMNLLAAARLTKNQFAEAAAAARRSIAVEAVGRAEYDHRHGTKTPPPRAAAHPYRLLAAALLGMERAEEAIIPATEGMGIDPQNAEVYALLGNALLGVSRPEEAAITIAQGMMVTGSPALRQDLVNYYQSVATAGNCALVAGPNGPAINPVCPVVHSHLCEAATRGKLVGFLKELRCEGTAR